MKNIPFYPRFISMIIVFLLSVQFSSAHYGPRGLLGGSIHVGIQHQGIVYFGTEKGGVYISTNTLQNGWRVRNVGLKSGNITALMHSGTDLYTATADSGVYIFNGSAGGTDLFWNPRSNGLTNLSVLSLVAVDTNTIIAGTNGSGLFITTNKGQNWTAINSSLLNSKKVTALTKGASRLFALVEDGGVFASDNNGTTWSDLNDANTLNKDHSEYFSYNAATDELLVSNHDGLFVLAMASTTSMPSYSAASTGLPTSIHVHNLTNNGTNWYLSSHSGIYQTAASSVNWTAINTGLPTNNVGVVVALGDSVLVAGTHKRGAFRTNAATPSWAAVNSGTHGISNIATYSVTGKGDSVTVTATEYGIVFSNNLGNTPQIRNNGLTDSLNVNDVEFAGNYLLAATKNAGVFWSNNLGLSWQAINTGLNNNNIVRIAYANGRKYVIDADGKIYHSEESATSWQDISNGIAANDKVTSVAFYAEWMFVGTYGGGVYRKHRDDASWTAFNSGGLTNLNVTAITASAGKVYAGTDGSGIFVSNLDNANWAATNPISIAHFNDVPINPNHIQYMTSYSGYMIASYRGGAVATVDGGNSWIRAGHQFHLPSFSDIRKIGFINTRIMVSTQQNSMMSNSLSEFALIDTILTVSAEQVSSNAQGKRSYHTVTSNIKWKITSSAPWVTLSVDSGSGNLNVYLDVAVNTGSPRTATVTLTGGDIIRTITVNQDGVTGLSDVIETTTLIYPNPNNGQFVLSSNGKLFSVIITDISGRVMYSQTNINQDRVEISSPLPTGMYIAQTRTDKGASLTKLIVE